MTCAGFYDECDAAGIFVQVNVDEVDTFHNVCHTSSLSQGSAPELDEAREAINITKKVRKFARKYLEHQIMSTPPNTPSTPPPQNSTVLNNRYRLLAIVASGGMATVYKAQDMQLNRLVAIKMLRDRYARDPQFVQRFREEAQAAANLNHPNIVTIFDVGRTTPMALNATSSSWSFSKGPT